MSWDYAKLAAHIAGGRDKKSRPLSNNTWAELRFHGPVAGLNKPDIAVRLHSTDVLTYHANGDVEFDTGGWETVTTKARIREYGPRSGWTVGAAYRGPERGILMLDRRTGRGTQQHAFFDGITVSGRTGQVKAKDAAHARKLLKKAIAEKREERRQAAKYARDNKRTEAINAGIDALFAFLREPFIRGATAVCEGFAFQAATCEAYEAVATGLAELCGSFEVARVVEAEVPPDAIDAWHFIRPNRTTYYGNLGPIEVGQVWHVPAALSMCRVGLHASPTPMDAAGYVSPTEGWWVCRVKLWGAVSANHPTSKYVAAYRKVVAMAELPLSLTMYDDADFNARCAKLVEAEVTA